jgi:hypothetical protein
MKHDEDMTEQENPYVGSVRHRIVMFIISTVFLVILVRVIIVAVPGYDFKVFFESRDELSKFDSIVIRGASFICAIPLMVLAPAFGASIFSEKANVWVFDFMKDLDPFLSWFDRKF